MINSRLNKVVGVVILFTFVGSFIAYAQPGPPPPNPEVVPISGIGYLLAIGGAFGIKKIYDYRNRNREE